MPGGNGTGPMGMGPMTGGGRGYCAEPMGRPFGRGRGRFGFGRGWGRKRGWRRGWFGYEPNASEFTPQQEAELLQKEAKAMQDEIKFINQRISELESEAKKAK